MRNHRRMKRIHLETNRVQRRIYNFERWKLFNFLYLFFYLSFFWRTKVSWLGRCIIKNSSSSSSLTKESGKVENFFSDTVALQRLTRLPILMIATRQTNRSIDLSRERIRTSRFFKDGGVMRVLTVCSTIRGISDDGGRESTFAKPEGLHGNL